MWAFLSVLTACAAGLSGFAMWLHRRPAITQQDYTRLSEEIEKLAGRVNKLHQSKL